MRILKYKFISNLKNIVGKGNLVQPVLFTGNGTVSFGKDVFLGTKQSPFFYSGYCYIDVREKEASINIGDRVWSNNNLTIISQKAGVSIGNDTIIGSNVEIYDSDFHNIDPTLRKSAIVDSAKVVIGENVWIGSNVKILKGVKIGSNSIIGNNSVVTKSVPANTIWGGVPAKQIKKIEHDDIS